MTVRQTTARDAPELADRNLALAGNLLADILRDPALLEQIPDEVTLVPLPADDPELTAYNLDLGCTPAAAGEDVYFRHVPPAHRPGEVMVDKSPPIR